MARSRFLASLATCVALIAAIAAPASEASAQGDQTNFYAVPDPLPKAKPGSLIRAVRIDAPDGANAWRVLYHSTAVDGRDIAVSGVVVAPTGKKPLAGRPVVSWAHGTTGDADICAPSKNPDVASLLPYVGDLVRAGYVVAATDYEGLGTPGVHPYLVGESEGRSVLDAARAARRVDGTGAGRDLLITGHSQGGHAALFAGELARSYAPELRLRGVAALAPAADLETIFPAAAAIPQAAGFTVLAAAGFQAAYDDADPALVLAPDAVAALPIADQICAQDVIRQFAGTTTSIVAHDPLTTQPWSKLLHASSAGNRRAGAPLLVAQGAADRLVVQPLTDSFVQKACARGDVVDYRVYDGADHGGVVAAARSDVVAWLAARMSGEAARSTCPIP
jgi:alpha-beta hydrolase superfamily lysophospholipase